MYSYTPTSKFLVLAPIEAGPSSITSADQSPAAARERSSSQSSTVSVGSQVGDAVSSLPQPFLYLGMDQRK